MHLWCLELGRLYFVTPTIHPSPSFLSSLPLSSSSLLSFASLSRLPAHQIGLRSWTETFNSTLELHRDLQFGSAEQIQGRPKFMKIFVFSKQNKGFCSFVDFRSSVDFTEGKNARAVILRSSFSSHFDFQGASKKDCFP